jgi:hypothetical protein
MAKEASRGHRSVLSRFVRSASATPGSPHARSAPKAAVKASGRNLPASARWPPHGSRRDTAWMMSEESTTAFRSGDLDAEMSLYAPEGNWEEAQLGLTFEGSSTIRGSFEDWRGRYEGYDLETEDFLNFGNGVAFLKQRETGRPVGSPDGIRVEESCGYMYVVDGGRIVRVVSSRDVNEVRAAAQRLAESRG